MHPKGLNVITRQIQPDGVQLWPLADTIHMLPTLWLSTCALFHLGLFVSHPYFRIWHCHLRGLFIMGWLYTAQLFTSSFINLIMSFQSSRSTIFSSTSWIFTFSNALLIKNRLYINLHDYIQDALWPWMTLKSKRQLSTSSFIVRSLWVTITYRWSSI